MAQRAGCQCMNQEVPGSIPGQGTPHAWVQARSSAVDVKEVTNRCFYPDVSVPLSPSPPLSLKINIF